MSSSKPTNNPAFILIANDKNEIFSYRIICKGWMSAFKT
jgi:hypothetical protein